MGELDINSLGNCWAKIFAFNDIAISPISGVAKFTLEDIAKDENQSKKPQVYVNGDVTTLKVDGKVYHSRPEKGEKFDLEKGILVCLAKSCGWSTTEILKLKETAKVQRKCEKKKKKCPKCKK